MQDFLKRYVGQRVGRWILKKIILLIMPYAAPLLLVFLLWYIAYATIFYLPKTIEESEGVLAFFYSEDDTWTLEQDERLGETYRELTEKDMGEKTEQPFTPSPYEQTQPYQLDWALLGAIDRFFGDPILNERKLRNPQPEKHHEAVQPKFQWRDSTVVHTVCSEDGGCTTTTYTVTLLVSADTYNAFHELKYREEVKETKYTRLVREVLDHVETTYYSEEDNRLHQLLDYYGLPREERDFIYELQFTYSDDPRRDEKDYLLGRYGNAPLPNDFPPLNLEAGLPLAGTVGKDFYITSQFGTRRDPFTGRTAFHDGVDFGAPTGTPVYAPLDGVVTFASNMNGYGNTILIGHGGVITLYAHLSYIHVKVNDRVKKGDLIGRVGSTGRSTGPHLHWGAYRNAFGKQNAFNPLEL